jgi:hypothetical protein
MPAIYGQLTSEGPIIELFIGVSIAREQALRAAGRSVPASVLVRLLIDTGASHTSIVGGRLTPLGLTPSGFIQIHSASTGGTPVSCPLFDVSLIWQFPNGVSITLPTIPVSEIAPLPGTIHGLLGRDILSIGQLHYLGQATIFSFVL